MRLSGVVLQIVIAALAGYAGARFAMNRTPDLTPVPPSAIERTVPEPAPEAKAPPPAPPRATAATGTATAAALSVSYRTAVERAAPSVLTVHSARTAARGPLGLGGRTLLSEGLGSGVLVNAEGYVVTNNHVVADANELAVALPDGTLRPVKLIGVDADSDLALLKIDPAGLKPIVMGDPKTLAVGDVVLAVGNPLGVGQTVTQGIVSALGRKGIGINSIENFIQTDAAINPGNSGGALIDTAGRLVGINSAILSRGGGSEGIGFAIPADLMQKVVASLQKNGRVARGYLGVSTGQAQGVDGAQVVAVQRGGPADKAGVRPGDVIVRIGDTPIAQAEDLAAATMQLDPGTRVTLEIMRDGSRGNAEVQLGQRPPLRRTAGG